MPPLRVLESASGVMGPFAGQLFAHRGADVITVEPPEGDWTCGAGADGSAPHDGLFQALNEGKRGVTLDSSTERGRDLLRALVGWADVVIGGPELTAAGVNDDDLRDWNPETIRSWVTPFGLSGPYRLYHAESIQLLALGGSDPRCALPAAQR